MMRGSATRSMIRSFFLYPAVVLSFSLCPPTTTNCNTNSIIQKPKFRMTSDLIHLENVLPYKVDRYEGVIVDSSYLPPSAEMFSTLLKSSLVEWTLQNKRGVWLKVPIEKSEYIPIAVKAGFAFHHAEARYVMLTTWLSQDENHLPPNASHQVGVGCVVVSPDKKLLLVQERNGPLKGTGIWKLPTGLVDAGEDIAEAARREVMEETGIETEFISTLCFRQAHNMQFGKSDLFFVCLLRPTSSEIAHQQTEIHACEWKDPEHLFDQEFFKESELHRKVNSLIQDSIDSAAADTTNGRAIEMVKLDIGFRPGQNTLHYVAKQSR